MYKYLKMLLMYYVNVLSYMPSIRQNKVLQNTDGYFFKLDVTVTSKLSRYLYIT